MTELDGGENGFLRKRIVNEATDGDGDAVKEESSLDVGQKIAENITELRNNPTIQKLKLTDLADEATKFALSSDIWRYAAPTPNCDVLVTLAPSHPRGQCIAIWLVEQIKAKSQLVIEVRYHQLTDCYGLYLTSKYINLLKGAELLHVKKPVKSSFGGGKREFSLDDAECFVSVERKSVFLTGQERASIVKAYLEMIRAPKGGLSVTCLCPEQEDTDPLPKLLIREGQAIVSALISKKLIHHILPLHESNKLHQLRSNWVSSLTSVQPLHDIRDYYGTQIGLYFAWLGHYTSALCVPAAISLVIYWFGWLNFVTDQLDGNDGLAVDNRLFSDVCFVAFALFNCIWSTVYLESWKRRQAELAYQWGTLGMDLEIDEPRPDFKGEKLIPSPITGRLEPYYPTWKSRLIRYGVTAPVTVGCITLMFFCLFFILRLQDICNDYFGKSVFLRWITYLPNMLYALLILVGDSLYKQLALFLNNLENYRTDDEHENHLIAKIALFQCVSAFGSLFYIAFYLQDMKRLQETLATVFITRQVIQNLLEVVVPYFSGQFKLSHLTYRLTRSMSQETLKKHVQTIRKKRNESSEGPQEKESPVFENSALRFRGKMEKTKSVRLPLPEFHVSSPENGPEITQAELESLLPQYVTPLDDYLEMFVQFGYVLLFSPAFPLAALCALINNILEIRIDAFKLCNNVQRPFGRRVKEIGTWQHAMELMGVVGVVVNCALIGQSGLVQRFWPNMSFGGQILFIVILEHLILALKYAIYVAIPDIPYWVMVEMSKMEFQRRETLKRESRRFRTSSTKLSPTCDVSETELASRKGHERFRSLTPVQRNERPQTLERKLTRPTEI